MENQRKTPEAGRVQGNVDSNFSMPSESKESQLYAMGDISVKQHRVLPHMQGRRIYQSAAEESESPPTGQPQAQAPPHEENKEPASQSQTTGIENDSQI